MVTAQGRPSSSGRPLAGGGPLDLHEESSDPRSERLADPLPPGGCQRWPETLRLVSHDGLVVRGRCGSPNQCGYCARLAAVENAELLALDALAGEAPRVWAVLTTRRGEESPRAFYRAREAVMRALRRRWPALEYCSVLEFTTGYGPASGGVRRPHWNLLLKGVEPGAVDHRGESIEDVIRRVWCGRPDTDSAAHAQFVGEVAEVGGLMRYLALHFQKESQAPPAGWRGHRMTKSRGYLRDRTPLARECARASLRFKRELWRARQRGLRGEPAELVAREQFEIAAKRRWTTRVERCAGPVRPLPAGRRAQAPEPTRREHGLLADMRARRGRGVRFVCADSALLRQLQLVGPASAIGYDSL